MTTLRLFRMLSSSRSSGTATFVLPIVAFAVVTALLLIVLGGAFSFFGWSGSGTDDYKYLASIALALLVAPLLTLGGSAARLSARRRDDRLSTLRLLGATPALVARLTILESAVLALIGAVVGIVAYVALVPAVGLIPFRGEALGASIWLAPWVVGIVVVGVAALAALSAAIGLRGVIVSPLGVRTRQTVPRPHWIRLVLGVVAVIVVYTAMKLLRADMGFVTVLLVFGLGFGLTISVLNLAGPFVLRVVATWGVRRAKTPQRLLAARGILESPKAAWRQVSGVAMTSFIAVFAGVGIAVSNSMGSDSLGFVLDIRTGVIITLVASFLMVACSVGVNQASAILDRRDLYLSLDRLGMPAKTMDVARTRAVMSPLRLVSIGSALTAAVVMLPLTGMALLQDPASLLIIAACLVVGIVVVWLGLRATRPVLRRVLAEPERAVG
ncbi:FtsX-like permease family protein [Parafrigoribacterium soli]|uniref:FtsX-like permease family protein n=1 Tax=Parafrigoribacterium soli TaxID=3144663 RepID=UPI0032EF7A53